MTREVGDGAGAWQSRTLQPHPAGRMGLHPARDTQRQRGQDRYLHHHNTRRGHTALGGKPPTIRLTA